METWQGDEKPVVVILLSVLY